MIRLEKGNEVALVALSNALQIEMKAKIEALCEVLKKLGLNPICSGYLYQNESVRGASAKQKARELEMFFEDMHIKAIFDVSGGDIANEVLGELNWQVLQGKKKIFLGYSDLTTIVNALNHKLEIPTYLYQVRNLVEDCREVQQKHFRESLLEGKESLFEFEYNFVQGEEMKGKVVGGNIRCLLKLAGTPYMPDFEDKILFLESRSGGVAQMITFLSQYKQLGVFKKVKGILLGSFTQMEKEALKPTIETLVKEIVDNPQIPIAKTKEIGHGMDSKAIKIGEMIELCK